MHSQYGDRQRFAKKKAKNMKTNNFPETASEVENSKLAEPKVLLLLLCTYPCCCCRCIKLCRLLWWQHSHGTEVFLYFSWKEKSLCKYILFPLFLFKPNRIILTKKKVLKKCGSIYWCFFLCCRCVHRFCPQLNINFNVCKKKRIKFPSSVALIDHT